MEGPTTTRRPLTTRRPRSLPPAVTGVSPAKAHIVSPKKRTSSRARDAKKKDKRTAEEHSYDAHEPTDAPYKLPSKDFSHVDFEVDLQPKTPQNESVIERVPAVSVDDAKEAKDTVPAFSVFCSCLAPSETSIDERDKFDTVWADDGPSRSRRNFVEIVDNQRSVDDDDHQSFWC